MKKILFITYYWPPSGGAGVQRGLKFVKYLPQFGVRPIVLSVDPESASYPTVDPSLDADVPTGVRVIRTGSFEPLRVLAAMGGKNAVPHAGFAGTQEQGIVQRAMRWVRGNWMIPDARRGWVKHAVRAAAEVIGTEGIDTILISSPPHSSQLIGLELKKRFPHLRWIADLRDPWTDIYFTGELMKGRRAQRLDAGWEERVMKTADAIVVVGPGMKRSFAERHGEDVGKKIAVIPNGYDAADLAAVQGVVPVPDRFRITYVGTMAGSYAPRTLFEAVASCAASSKLPIELRFVGSVSDDIKAIATDAGIAHLCSWIPTVPHEQAIREMAAANMLLLVIPGGAGSERILTGKLFEYLGVRRPIIGLGPVNGDAAAIINECAAGRMFARDMGAEMCVWLEERSRGTGGQEVSSTSVVHYERRGQARQLAEILLQR